MVYTHGRYMGNYGDILASSICLPECRIDCQISSACCWCVYCCSQTPNWTGIQKPNLHFSAIKIYQNQVSQQMKALLCATAIFGLFSLNHRSINWYPTTIPYPIFSNINVAKVQKWSTNGLNGPSKCWFWCFVFTFLFHFLGLFSSPNSDTLPLLFHQPLLLVTAAAGHRGAVPSRSGPAAHLKASPILVDFLLVAASKEAETLGVWMGVSRCLKMSQGENVWTCGQNFYKNSKHVQQWSSFSGFEGRNIVTPYMSFISSARTSLDPPWCSN